MTNWINRGAPDDESILAVLRRLFGADAAATILNHTLTVVASHLSCAEEVGPLRQEVGVELKKRFLENASIGDAIQENQRWAAMLLGGGDPLHLTHHLESLLLGDGAQQHELTYPCAAGSSVAANLHVRGSVGWYKSLGEAADGLPERADGRSWRVRVTTEDLGYIGEFRRSRQTGRWFAGKHSSHMLGN